MSYVIFVCGVSGSGKTTIAQELSKQLQIDFCEGEAFHAPANIEKMRRGVPLQDEDRHTWLLEINAYIRDSENSCVVACSALKQSYRVLLSKGVFKTIVWVFLNGRAEVIKQRIDRRGDHFFPASLLPSQFEALELPDDAIVCDIEQPIDCIVESILKEMNLKKKQFGLIGLGVMGKSLVRNMASNGIALSIYNRTVPNVEENVAAEFINKYLELQQVAGYDDLVQFVDSLEKPRKIFLMIPAGKAIDEMQDLLIPHLAPGDIIMDGGNTHFQDTARRVKLLAEKGIHWLGVGVSGGEEGALRGPSIMVGGDQSAYQAVQFCLEPIAAKGKSGQPCCSYIGNDGAGHFVKMVHNGIEYAEMQLLAEVYGLLKYVCKLDQQPIIDLLEAWNKTDVESYLLGATINILKKKEGQEFLIDKISDCAMSKGTGGWTITSACDLGVPVPTIAASLFARFHSAHKNDRVQASKEYTQSFQSLEIPFDNIRVAYQAARIINHHQGFHLISKAAEHYQWDIDLSKLAEIWTGGCIIQSALMAQITHFMKDNPMILMHPKVVSIVQSSVEDLREINISAIRSHYPMPCFQAALEYLEMFRTEQSTAHIIQAQRDYFGAHRYERKDDPSGKTYHTDWKC